MTQLFLEKKNFFYCLFTFYFLYLCPHTLFLLTSLFLFLHEYIWTYQISTGMNTHSDHDRLTTTTYLTTYQHLKQFKFKLNSIVSTSTSTSTSTGSGTRKRRFIDEFSNNDMQQLICVSVYEVNRSIFLNWNIDTFFWNIIFLIFFWFIFIFILTIHRLCTLILVSMYGLLL